jgi:hypothetical protein
MGRHDGLSCFSDIPRFFHSISQDDIPGRRALEFAILLEVRDTLNSRVAQYATEYKVPTSLKVRCLSTIDRPRF